MEAAFAKMHGCGNDFVVFDERAGGLGLTQARSAALADRRTGVGCDQLIAIEAPPPGSAADVYMRIRNPDGREAGACGNATRCVAQLLFQQTGNRVHTIQTDAGALFSEVLPSGKVLVDMGAVKLGWQDIPLAREADTLHLDLAEGPVADAAAASIGNPHATFFVDDVSAIPVEQIGPILEHASLFPERANIGFAQVLSPERIRLRLWERGAGLTRACGSGACAAWVNATRRGLTRHRGTVVLDGGELDILYRPDGSVVMVGPTATAFRGTIDLSRYPS